MAYRYNGPRHRRHLNDDDQQGYGRDRHVNHSSRQRYSDVQYHDKYTGRDPELNYHNPSTTARHDHNSYNYRDDTGVEGDDYSEHVQSSRYEREFSERHLTNAENYRDRGNQNSYKSYEKYDNSHRSEANQEHFKGHSYSRKNEYASQDIDNYYLEQESEDRIDYGIEDRFDHDRGDRIDYGLGDRLGHGGGDMEQDVWLDKRETNKRPYQKLSAATPSLSHSDQFDPVYIPTQHRETNELDDHYESYIRKDNFRDTRHEQKHRSGVSRRIEPLIKDIPVSNERYGPKGIRRNAIGKSIKYEPLIKEEPLSHFNDFLSDNRHRLLLPSNRNDSNINSGVQDQMYLDITSKPKRGLLATPDIEFEDDQVVSVRPDQMHVDISSKPKRGLLATPDIEFEDDQVGPDQMHLEITSKPRRGLLATPDIEVEDDQVISESLLPTPNSAEVGRDMISFDEDIQRKPTFHSAGLLPTPSGTSESSLTHFSTGLLLTPTVSPDLDQDEEMGGLYHNQKDNLSDSSAHDTTAVIDVETIVYPSKGLLPTPKGSPTESIRSHPLGENDDIDSSVSSFECKGKKGYFNNSKSRKVARTEERPNSKSKQTSKNNDESPNVDTEKRMLKNIMIQLELTKTLEGMQKTMQTLQKTIQTNPVKVKRESNKKSEKEKESMKNFTEMNGVTVCKEVIQTDEDTSETPINITIENDNQKIEKSDKISVNGETQDEEPADQISDTIAAISEQECSPETKLFKKASILSKEKSHDNLKIPKNNSGSKAEYKTYREWRLARERMNRYFNKQCSESNMQNRGKSHDNRENKNNQRTLSIQNEDVSKTIVGEKLNAENNGKTDESDRPNLPDDIKLDSKLNLQKSQDDGDSRERDTSELIKERRKTETESERGVEGLGNERQENKSVRIESNQLKERVIENIREQDKSEIIDNIVQMKPRSDSLQRSRRESSDSSSHRAREKSTSRNDRSRSADDNSGKSHKSSLYKSSHEEHAHHKHKYHKKSHRHSHSEKHHSSNKERHRHHSGSRDEQSSKYNDRKDRHEIKSHEGKDKRLERETAKAANEACSNVENEKVYIHKSDAKMRDNLFEKLSSESDIIDVVGGISSDEQSMSIPFKEHESAIDTRTKYQEKNGGRNLKTAFVKLYDINKIKANVSKSDKGDSSKYRENIFEKMSGNTSISSSKESKSCSTKIENKSDKNNTSCKSVRTFTPIVLVSEESSTEEDPFVKMSQFLNKDKRKSVLTMSKSKILNASASKKSKPLNNFFGSRDNTSGREERDTTDYEVNETNQYLICSSRKKDKDCVKHLRNVDKTLYWRNVKLLLPRVNLKRLNDSNIKWLKLKLKQDSKQSRGEMKGNSKASDKSGCDNFKEQKQINKSERSDANKSKYVKVETEVNAEKEKKNHGYEESLSSDVLSTHNEKGMEQKKISENIKTESSLDQKEKDDKLENSKCQGTNIEEMKKGFDGKRFKRIIPVQCSSTEQSESSDIERIVNVSQRNKMGPVIIDSSESEELEGSLGSEDSTCLDMSDAGIEIEVSSKENCSDTEGMTDDISCTVQANINTVVNEKENLPETGQKSEILSKSLEKPQVSNIFSNEVGLSETESVAVTSGNNTKRNIFAAVNSDCSTQSEEEAGQSNSLIQRDFESGKIKLESNSNAFYKVKAHLGKTLKNLKMKPASEESSGPDFVCLSERRTMFQKISVKKTITTSDDYDDVDGDVNNDTLPSKSLQEMNEEHKSPDRKTANDFNATMTCSVSAGKYTTRRKCDSSTDSSEDENMCENQSAPKYRKKLMEKASEQSEQTSKNNGEGSKKNFSQNDSVLGRQSPSKLKRLFKPSVQIKRTSSIMQMDGNADMMAGPPDESSGEEGDVEDNIYIESDSEDVNSASQDLFADVPAMFKQMSQKLRQITGLSDTVKTEKKDLVVENEGTTASQNIENEGSTTVDNESTTAESVNSANEDMPAIKDEPEWPKFDYTQEPETIFLSDDDEMIMSVSQPIILVSDDDTQDPETVEKQVLDKVKQEKSEPDNKYGSQDTTFDSMFENYTSAEDWSDNGSDFEPENMVKSLQKKNLKTEAVDSDQNSSDCSLFSDNDIYESQSLLDPNKNTSNEKDGFDSSDEALKSVDEEILLRSPNSDEAIMSINEDELLGIRSSSKNDEQTSENIESKNKTNVNKDFSSTDDEILLTSAFNIETKYKRKTATKTKPTVNFKTDTDVLESSQKYQAAWLNHKDDDVTRKSSEDDSNSNLKFKGANPYLQDTQIDPGMSDEDTSNSVTVFDFHSEHFSDISDCDSKQGNEIKSEKNSPKQTSNGNCNYETLSDDSDIMIIDNPQSEYEVQTQAEEILHKKIGTSIRDNERQNMSVYEEQTQVSEEIPEPRNEIHNELDKQTDENDMQDLYLAQTQVDTPGPSSASVKGVKKKSLFGQIVLRKEQKFGLPTKKEMQDSNVYLEQTQVDKPGPSDLSKDDDEFDFESSPHESFSDEDPQLQFYIKKNPEKNSMKNRRLSKSLGIKFESFSDRSDEEKITNNIYDTLTQVDQHANTQDKPTNVPSSSKKAVPTKSKEKEECLPKDANIAYHALTEAICSFDDETHGEDYRMLTQVDVQAEKQKTEENILDLSVDNDTYLAATQIYAEDSREHEKNLDDEGEDMYNIATQIQVDNVTKNKKKGKGFTAFMKDTKYLNNEQPTDTSSDDSAYLAPTQVNTVVEDEPKNKQVSQFKRFDNTATQKDIFEFSDSSDQVLKLVKKGLHRNNSARDVTDGNLHSISTQIDIDKSSHSDDDDDDEKDEDDKRKSLINENKAEQDERSDDDAYFIATQVDIENVSESDEEQVAKDNDCYDMATQKDTCEILNHDDQSDDLVERGFGNINESIERNGRENEHRDDFVIATQKDDDDIPANDDPYFMETQVDELPDIIQLSTEDEELIDTQDYFDTKSDTTKSDFPTKFNKTDSIDNKSLETGVKSILKRPNVENTAEKNVTFGMNCDSTASKRRRLSLSGRKTLPIEPQKMKTFVEKRASGVVTTFKPKQFFKSKKPGKTTPTIELYDASPSNTWLSKTSGSNKMFKKGTKVERSQKRKRKEDPGAALQAKMMAARSQLMERAMYNATHPDSVKRAKIGPTATSSEVEDVTLPTGSQIIGQGLPLLNTTGIILKEHKLASNPGTESVLPSSHGRVTTATISLATTTISEATSTSVPTIVQSSSLTVTSRLHQSNKAIGSEVGKSVSAENLRRERVASGDSRTIEKASMNVDKDHKKKEENSSNRRRSSEKGKNHDTEKGTDKVEIDKEIVRKEKDHDRKRGDRKNKETSHSVSRDSRKRSESGDSKKDREKKSKDRHTNKENDKQLKMSYDRNKEETNRSVDSKGDEEKHGKKKDESHSSRKKRHSSGSKKGKEKHASSTCSVSQNKEREFKSRSGENSKKSVSFSEKRDVVFSIKNDVIGGIMNISTVTSTSSSTPITTSPSIGVSTSSVFTSGVTPTASVSVTAGKPSTSVRNITTSVASGPSTVPSRSISRPVPSVRTTVSTHIESAVLLQKQSSRPSTSGISGSNLAPSAVTAGRQPFQPLAPNIPGNMELMPSNMMENVPNLQWNNFLRVILKWSPNWFEEREKMEKANRRAPPPDVTSDLCGRGNHVMFPLCEKYISFKEYSEKFMLPLLLHETWESCFSTWREKRQKRRVNQHKLMFSHQAQGGDKLMVYTLIGLISVRDRQMGNYVNEGDLVKIVMNVDRKIDDKQTENLNYTLSGFVDKVIFRDFSVDRICAHYKEMGEIRRQMRDCVSLKLHVRVRARSFIPNDKLIVHLESVSTIINTRRQFTGLSCLPRSPLCRHLLYPSGNMAYCDKAPAIVPGLQDRYNESQLTAINTAAKIVQLAREEPRICLLQGPPGTGKSHTIVGIIQHIVRVTKGQCRICLCAPSHAAVDELLRRLCKHNKTVDKSSVIKIVRLGKKSSVCQEIQSLCLDTLVQRNIQQVQKEELLKQLPQSLQGEIKSLECKIAAMRKNMETVKDQFQRQKLKTDLRKLEKQKEVLQSKYIVPKTNIDHQQEWKARSNLLLKAHVVAGTLSRIGGNELRSAFQNMSKPGFDVVIVDEATQAIELETLIPLQYGVTKLILVGDPEQLPPTVLSQVATENRFNMSLFERLDSHFRLQHINPVILLDTQYRMDPEIAAFPNNYVYDGKIKNDRCVEKRTQIPLVPYLLFNVSEGRELFSQGTRSMSNPLEAKFTAELCQFIVRNSSVIEKVIGIIAPYAKQKTEILKELEKRSLTNIEVSTVDGFQGREKHVIIMSCVRANETGTVGFVGNRNRMNVSLTRAKYAMYLVGHFVSLEKNRSKSSDEWKALIADARQRRKIEPVDQSNMKQAIKRILKQQSRDVTSKQRKY